MNEPISLAKRLVEAGISQPYASQISRGRRAPSLPLAIKIYRVIGVKMGPITDASEDEIDTLEKMNVKRVGNA